MKKLTAFLCALMCVSLFAFALDAGGTVSGSMTADAASATEVTFSPSVTMTAWIRQPLGSAGSFVTEGYGMYKNETLLADLSLLKATVYAGPCTFEMGRFSVSDGTGVMYNMAADGLFATWAGRYASLNLYGAYTGFLNSLTLSINGLEGTYTPATEWYDVAATPKFAVGMTRFTLPSLVLGQSLSADGLVVYSVDGTEALRGYGTVALWGPIVPLVYYSLNGAASYVAASPNGTAAKTGLFAKGSISWYPSAILSAVSGSVSYADKNLSTFTAGGPGSDGTLLWNSVVDAQISLTAKPASIIVTSLTADVIAAGGDDGQLQLHSYQWKLSGAVQAASDVSLGLSVGEVVPLQTSVSPSLSGTVSATLAF